MSYGSRHAMPHGTSLKRVSEVIDLLGYVRANEYLSVPNMIASYHWYDAEEYKSWSGVELQLYLEDGAIFVSTRSTASRSYWDIVHQNKTIKTLRDLFRGQLETDAGRSRYWKPDEPPPKPIVSGCYLARWRFKNSLIKSHIYLSARKLEGNMAREAPTGFHFIDELNPRLLSNNLLIPFVIAVWEEYFRSTFAVILKYSEQREQVLKRARITYLQVEQFIQNMRPTEQIISECFSFQRPSIIGENFRILDTKLDLAAVMRKPFMNRKTSLYDSIEKLVENRNAFVHAGEIDMVLYDKELTRTIADITEAVDRCYQAIGYRFGFEPLTSY